MLHLRSQVPTQCPWSEFLLSRVYDCASGRMFQRVHRMLLFCMYSLARCMVASAAARHRAVIVSARPETSADTCVRSLATAPPISVTCNNLNETCATQCISRTAAILHALPGRVGERFTDKQDHATALGTVWVVTSAH